MGLPAMADPVQKGEPTMSYGAITVKELKEKLNQCPDDGVVIAKVPGKCTVEDRYLQIKVVTKRTSCGSTHVTLQEVAPADLEVIV